MVDLPRPDPQEMGRFMEELPSKELIEPKDRGLGHAAKSVRKKADASLSVINQARQHLRDEPVHAKVRDFSPPPKYYEVFTMPGEDSPETKWAVAEIEFFRQIVEQYKNGEYDVHGIETDLLKISSNLVYFSGWVNYIDGASTHLESVRKEAELRAFLEVRQWAERNEISIRVLGADTLKALAVEETKDLFDLATKARTIAATIKGFYYALKDFASYLDRVSQRAQVERMGTRHTT